MLNVQCFFSISQMSKIVYFRRLFRFLYNDIMRQQKLKQALVKCLLNYRIIFAYFMATTFLFMHYFVTSSEFEATPSMESRRINSFNSKKLLNVHNRIGDEVGSKRRGKYFGLERLLSSRRIVVNKLVIDPPSTFAYSLKNTSTQFYSQILQDRILVDLLNETGRLGQHGLFVEAGAYDGETWSNTLHLERFHNWIGLLVEPSPETYRVLRAKNRRAYSINSCLCAGNSSLKSSFIEAGPFGTVASADLSTTTTIGESKVTCHPLARILDEFFRTIHANSADQQLRLIDYLSLDIEGNERSIVETFPWNQYRFNFLNIEFNQKKEVYTWLKSFLTKFGYVETVQDDVWFQDLYMAHQSVLIDSQISQKPVLKVSEFLKKVR